MTKKDVNEYLYYEFGIDGDEASISEDWPFRLQPVGTLRLQGERIEFYEFTDEETDYYAQEGFYFPKAGMTLNDLYLQHIGEQWISEQEPVDLDTTIISDDRVPKVIERRHAIETLASRFLGEGVAFDVVEGLFFPRTGSYVSLIEVDTWGVAVVVGSEFQPISVGFPEASSRRRLAHAVGKIKQGKK